MEPFIGEIMLFAGDYEPVGWKFCNGQSLSMNNGINDYSSLFAVIGNRYGGNYHEFNLPNLNGRTPLHPSNDIELGEYLGYEEITLFDEKYLPKHTHQADFEPIGKIEATIKASDGTDTQTLQSDPDLAYWTVKSVDGKSVKNGYSHTHNTTMNPKTVEVKINSGGSNITGGDVSIDTVGEKNPESFPIREPYLTLNYLICVSGRFPPRP